MEREEQELVKKAKKGEAAAFGNLYDKHIPAIYRFVLLKVGNKPDAEDICHQVFLSAWQNIQGYRFQGFPFSSWLYRIASNAVIDHWRTKKPNVSIDLVSENFLSETNRLDVVLDKETDLNRIRLAVAKLEPDQQNVIIMKFVNELSNKEIAGALGKSEGAVRVIQHRALKQLKKMVDEQ